MLAWWRSAYRTTSRSGEITANKFSLHAAKRRNYLALLSEHADRHQLRVLGYCLMPNHVHVVAVPERFDSLAKALVARS